MGRIQPTMKGIDTTFLRPEDIEKEFGFSLRQQARWRTSAMGDNVIPYYRLGKYVLYKKEDILKWIESFYKNPKKNSKWLL